MKKDLVTLAAVLCIAATSPMPIGSTETDNGTVAQAEETAELIEITLETPGTLGVEILYKADVLSDVKRLKVTGTFNDADWTTVSNLSSIQEIDLSGVSATSVPQNAFKSKGTLTRVSLPGNAASIGQSAFEGTSITSITIPASVTVIDEQAFYGVKTLVSVEFANGSKLSKINNTAFYSCTALTKIHIPEGCTVIDSYAFEYCNNLTDLSLPSTLAHINSNAFGYTEKLQDVIFPENLKKIDSYAFRNSGLTSIILPVGLSELGVSAFYLCKQATKVQLPSYIPKYNNNFSSCTSLKEVICPAATPPTFSNAPFDYNSHSAITLTVPDFAVASYKLDSYWMQFGKIQGGAEVSLCNIASALSLTNDRRIDGEPDVNILEGGSITIGGHAPQNFGSLMLKQNFNDSYNYKFSQIISNCPSISAHSLRNSVYLNANTWYFITPVGDILRSQITHTVASAAFAIRRYSGEKRAADGSGGWTNLADDEALEGGKGYIIQTNKTGWVEFQFELASPQSLAGIVQSGDVSLPLENWPAEIAANAGWNFLGNPYPSYFDAHFIDFPAPITIYDPKNYNYKAYSMADDDIVLQPMQPFFVQKPDGIDEVTFLKEGRQTSDTPNTGAYKSSLMRASSMTPASRIICNLTISGNGLSDVARVVINPNASLRYETKCDAAKMMSAEPDALQLWSIGDNDIPMAINERPKADGYVSIAAMLPKAGEYTISVDCADPGVVILDRLTSAEAKSHKFTATGSECIKDRYALVADVKTSSISDTAIPTAVSINGNVVSAESETIVYTIDGRTAAHINAGSFSILPQGIYVARSKDGNVTKFIVKNAGGK